MVALLRRALSGETDLILGPLAERVEALAAAGRGGDAAFAQEQLRALAGALRRQAMVDGLRASGRLTVDVAGHQVELDGGRLVAVDQGPSPRVPAAGGATTAAAGRAGWAGREEADELLAVSRWLRREARAGRVRVVGRVDASQAAALAAVLEGVENPPSSPRP